MNQPQQPPYAVAHAGGSPPPQHTSGAPPSGAYAPGTPYMQPTYGQAPPPQQQQQQYVYAAYQRAWMALLALTGACCACKRGRVATHVDGYIT